MCIYIYIFYQCIPYPYPCCRGNSDKDCRNPNSLSVCTFSSSCCFHFRKAGSLDRSVEVVDLVPFPSCHIRVFFFGGYPNFLTGLKVPGVALFQELPPHPKKQLPGTPGPSWCVPAHSALAALPPSQAPGANPRCGSPLLAAPTWGH